MLSYQHAYHAGSAADVHKHVTLSALLNRLHAKASAITCVDTHAGRGLYPLDASETQRGGEYITGVVPIWTQRERLAARDPVLKVWLDDIASLNGGQRALSRYPGSPWWFGHTLRDQDRLALFELHPGEVKHLEHACAALPHNVRVTFSDGPHSLLQQLPYPTPRLCVLIDPSYELKHEYAGMANTLAAIAHKVRHAIVMLWYPILPQGYHDALLSDVVAQGVRNVWQSELMFRSSTQGRGMCGSGLLILNPPWRLNEALSKTFSLVAEVYGDSASHRGQWLVEE